MRFTNLVLFLSLILLLSGCALFEKKDERLSRYIAYESTLDVLSTKSVKEAKNKLGLKPNVAYTEIAWQYPFPKRAAAKLIDKQYLVYAVLDLTKAEEGPREFLQSILDGDWDEYLQQIGEDIAEVKYPVFLEINMHPELKDDLLPLFEKVHGELIKAASNALWVWNMDLISAAPDTSKFQWVKTVNQVETVRKPVVLDRRGLKVTDADLTHKKTMLLLDQRTVLPPSRHDLFSNNTDRIHALD